MKKIILSSILVLIAAACIIYVPSDYDRRQPDREYYDETTDYSDVRDISMFHDSLSPYGIWVRHHSFGYVWIPRVNRYGWRPYTYGRWIWTDLGWMWRSSFSWGWAPFHYGRWGWDADLGWFWVPGMQWAPSWVAWRTGGLYIGWAALPPDIRYYRNRGITSLPYAPPDGYWVFVVGNHFLSSRVQYYTLPLERNFSVMRRTVMKVNLTPRGTKIINSGLDADYVRKAAKSRLDKYILQDVSLPDNQRIGMGRVKVFRPELEETADIRPKTIVEKTEIDRRLSEKKIDEPSSSGAAVQKAKVEDVQQRQLVILEQTQDRDIEELQREMDKAKKTVLNSNEKEKIESNYKEKMEQLKSRHKTEKSQIKKRHESEKKKTVVKKTIKKD